MAMDTNSPPTPENVIAKTEKNPVSEYFSTLWTILTHPTKFFRDLQPDQVGVVIPILFAVLTHWLGSGLAYLWKMGFGKALEGRLSDFMIAFEKLSTLEEDLPAGTIEQMKDHFLTWVWGVGNVIIDPFLSVLSILVTSFLIWIASRILGDIRQPDADTRYSFDSAVTLVSYAYAPSILQGLPLVGGMVAGLFVFVVTYIGAREFYKVSSFRALIIALFPKLLILIFLLGIFFSFILLFMKLFIGS